MANPFQLILDKGILVTTQEYRNQGPTDGKSFCVCGCLTRLYRDGIIKESEWAGAKRYVNKVLGHRNPYVTNWLWENSDDYRSFAKRASPKARMNAHYEYRILWIKHMAQLWEERKIRPWRTRTT